jgi:hypothetical protein
LRRRNGSRRRQRAWIESNGGESRRFRLCALGIACVAALIRIERARYAASLASSVESIAGRCVIAPTSHRRRDGVMRSGVTNENR